MKFMKVFLFSMYFILTSLFCQSQNFNDEYVVLFTDKNNSPFSITNPSEYLTIKSIERRQRYSINIDVSDLPVNPSYINQIKSAGGNIKYSLKWLNGVVLTGSNNLQAIGNLPFVKEIKKIKDGNASNKCNSDKKLSIVDGETVISKVSNKNSDIYDYGASYNQIKMISGNALHNAGYRGQGMTIAVLDAGFLNADTMSAFDSLRINNQILGSRDFVKPGENVYGFGMSPHGMMVLSTMGGFLQGQLIGTAPKANYWLLHSEDYYAEYVGEEYNWVAAAEFADSVGADIINSSLSYTTFDDTSQNHTYSQLDGNTTTATIGADLAAKKGILVICSAGNYGNTDWKYIGAPADGDSVLAVGAVKPDSTYANFSSTGPSFDKRVKPNVTAQGYNAVTAGLNGGISYQSGTSFSSPIIAGMAACLWQSKLNHNNQEIIHAIESSANQFTYPDSLLGYGIPNFLYAINLLGGIDMPGTEQKEIQIFPNPFSSFLSITFPLEITTVKSVQIFNTSGTKLFETNNCIISGNKLYVDNLSFLHKGFFIVKILCVNKVYASKIIKL
jgi:hypothetical protein